MVNKLALFEEKQIRKIWKDEKWYFSVVDVVLALTDSNDPKQYVKKLKIRDVELQDNWGTICTLIGMPTMDGKIRKIQMADTEGILRIIQSIPSPKAELEFELNRPVITSENYIDLTENKDLIENK